MNRTRNETYANVIMLQPWTEGENTGHPLETENKIVIHSLFLIVKINIFDSNTAH